MKGQKISGVFKIEFEEIPNSKNSNNSLFQAKDFIKLLVILKYINQNQEFVFVLMKAKNVLLDWHVKEEILFHQD